MNERERFRSLVKSHFKELTESLDSELSQIASGTTSTKVRFLLFEYESPHFADDFAVSAWPMSGDGEPVEDGIWLLRGEAVVVPAEIYEADEFQHVEPWDTASELLEEWMVERWSHVTAGKAPCRAFIGHHDSYFKRDLLTGERTDWDEITSHRGV